MRKSLDEKDGPTPTRANIYTHESNIALRSNSALSC